MGGVLLSDPPPPPPGVARPAWILPGRSRRGIGGRMVARSSTAALAAAVRTGHEIRIEAYLLHKGVLLDALEAAAEAGAHVTVRVEASPYPDPRGALRKQNEDAVAALRAAGADARCVPRPVGAPPLHMKDASVDGVRFYAERNWCTQDLILRDDARAPDGFASSKREALQAEAGLIARARTGDLVRIASESYDAGTPVHAALLAALARGVHVEVLLARRTTAAQRRERTAVQRLVDAGASVRTTAADLKCALDGTSAWLGSANATQQWSAERDWGRICTEPPVVRGASDTFDRAWARGRVL
jgi:hypothetical protein